MCVLLFCNTVRLFLTMEISPKIPVNLLRAGRILVFEPPPGIRANLLRTFSSVRTAVTAPLDVPAGRPLSVTHCLCGGNRTCSSMYSQ